MLLQLLHRRGFLLQLAPVGATMTDKTSPPVVNKIKSTEAAKCFCNLMHEKKEETKTNKNKHK